MRPEGGRGVINQTLKRGRVVAEKGAGRCDFAICRSLNASPKFNIYYYSRLGWVWLCLVGLAEKVSLT